MAEAGSDVRWGSLSADDVGDWAVLTNLLAVVDRTDEIYQAEDLAEELREQGFDPAADTMAVRVDGQLVGFGQLRVGMELVEGEATAWIHGGVHPDFRRRGFGTHIMDRLERRARQLSAERHPDRALSLKAPGGLDGASVRIMLARRGYQIVRHSHDMARDLPDQLPALSDRPVQRFSAELGEATRLAHNDAFSTHWGSSPRSAEQWQDMLDSRTFRPEASHVCLDADGQVLAYVIVRQWVPGEAWIDLVGTRQRARGQGLARACLAASLHAAAEQGYRTAALGVDSQNGQGAGALYSSLGFRLVRVQATFGKVVPALVREPAAREQ